MPPKRLTLPDFRVAAVVVAATLLALAVASVRIPWSGGGGGRGDDEWKKPGGQTPSACFRPAAVGNMMQEW